MKLFNYAVNLLFPTKCPFCGCVLEREEQLCSECQASLPWLEGSKAQSHVSFCTDCISPLYYDERVRNAIQHYKFHGVFRNHKRFGIWMAQCVQANYELAFDAVTWVPLHPKRKAERGYDQSELLAKTMAKALELPLVEALRKKSNIKAQSGITEDSARQANVLGVYELSVQSVEGQCLLLVDDVVTTGATLSEAARVLLDAGARKIYAVTLAKARSK